MLQADGIRIEIMLMTLSNLCLAAFLLLAAKPVLAQSASGAASKPANSSSQGAGPDKSASAMPGAGVSKLALAVAQLGVLRCVERADQVSKFLSRVGNEVMIVDRTAAGGPADMVTATLLVSAGASSYSTVEVSLIPTANGCSAYYAATIHAPGNCPDAEKKFYGALGFKPLEGMPYRLATISHGARVLSHQVAAGCLLTKNEVVR